MCMAIHDTIIERHICTSEWAVSNVLPSKGAGLEPLGKLTAVDDVLIKSTSRLTFDTDVH